MYQSAYLRSDRRGAAPAAFDASGPETARPPASAVFYHDVYPAAEDGRAQAAAAITAQFGALVAAAKLAKQHSGAVLLCIVLYLATAG